MVNRFYDLHTITRSSTQTRLLLYSNTVCGKTYGSDLSGRSRDVKESRKDKKLKILSVLSLVYPETASFGLFVHRTYLPSESIHTQFIQNLFMKPKDGYRDRTLGLQTLKPSVHP